jgi:hypothetical protein
MSSDNAKRDLEKEGKGYLMLMLIVILFPITFFLCAFFPMWMGWNKGY